MLIKDKGRTHAMRKYEVILERLDGHGSVLSCKDVEFVVDTDPDGRSDALNPAELLLGALAGCIAKGIERVAPLLQFHYTGLTVRVTGERQDEPPRMARMAYIVEIETDESDRRLELLHENVRKFGTVYNTLTVGTELSGRLIRTPRQTAATGQLPD